MAKSLNILSPEPFHVTSGSQLPEATIVAIWAHHSGIQGGANLLTKN